MSISPKARPPYGRILKKAIFWPEISREHVIIRCDRFRCRAGGRVGKCACTTHRTSSTQNPIYFASAVNLVKTTRDKNPASLERVLLGSESESGDCPSDLLFQSVCCAKLIQSSFVKAVQSRSAKLILNRSHALPFGAHLEYGLTQRL
jgi:hypothetical protein